MRSYLIGLVLIILLPGPNSIYVLTVAARRGVRTGYAAACGVFTGDAVLMFLSAIGIASLLKGNAALFTVVKFLGAGYLGWLALGLLRAAWAHWRGHGPVEVDATGEVIAGDERPYRRALVISLLNPKAILFFIAFFVQFVDPDYSRPWLSFILLGTLVEIASFCYLSSLIFFGSRLAAAVRRRRAVSAGGTSLVGVVFLAFAFKLATASAH
jgi:leucine efflux protein